MSHYSHTQTKRSETHAHAYTWTKRRNCLVAQANRPYMAMSDPSDLVTFFDWCTRISTKRWTTCERAPDTYVPLANVIKLNGNFVEWV